jgi:hypothetical protein
MRIKAFCLNDIDRKCGILNCFINSKCKSYEDKVHIKWKINENDEGKGVYL